jgi:rSAM/selenodomain-associated transferase 1
MMKALILMTRVPIPGKTKTRLMKILSGEECAKLHRCFLLDLFNIFRFIEDDIDIYLTYTPEKHFPLIKEYIPSHIQFFPQHGKNLGEKMHNSFEYLLNKGYTKVVLMGADIPDIQPTDINKAFEALGNHDIVLGPTIDGGYYLIGMRKVYREIFDDKLKWGNRSVLEGTIDIANSLGLRTSLIEKLRDIDTKEDLLAFLEKTKNIEDGFNVIPYNTINYLKSLWSDGSYAKGYFKG